MLCYAVVVFCKKEGKGKKLEIKFGYVKEKNTGLGEGAGEKTK